MMSYDDTAKKILSVLSSDLGIEQEMIWEEYENVQEKHKYKPSSILLALIEEKHPETKELVRLAHNVTQQAINQTRNSL